MLNKIKWIGTVFIVISMMLTSLNIYPLNLYAVLIGSVLWTYVGYFWRDNSIIMLNVLGGVIYLMGIVNSLI